VRIGPECAPGVRRVEKLDISGGTIHRSGGTGPVAGAAAGAITGPGPDTDGLWRVQNTSGVTA
jgi:hypothetical protein